MACYKDKINVEIDEFIMYLCIQLKVSVLNIDLFSKWFVEGLF